MKGSNLKYEVIPWAECVGLRLCEGRLPDVGEDDVGAVAVVGRDRRVDVDGAARRVTHVLKSHSHLTPQIRNPKPDKARKFRRVVE